MTEKITDGSNVLIVIGMHRSGTSLVASMLHSAGLYLGDQLMKAHETVNAKGFWENLDFVRFQERILEKLGHDKYGWALESDLQVPEEDAAQVDELLARNQKDQVWGWKDPRTTLFISYWAKRLPKANFLFVYRPQWEVADSLYRRGDPVFQENPRRAIETWTLYNEAILDFHEKNKERGLLLDLQSIVNNPDLLIDKLNKRFNLQLVKPAGDIFDESLIERSSGKSARGLAVQHFFPKANEVYKRLLDASDSLGTQVDSQLAEGEISEDELADCFLSEWVAARRAQRELKSGNKTLYSVRSELYDANEKLKTFEASRIWKIRNIVHKLKTPQD
jgi:O-antigen biosynthesis protein